MNSGYTVYYYVSSSGKIPFKIFLNSLGHSQQAKILRIIQTIREYGLISVIPHTKKLSGTDLWEIRILGKDNIRVIYVIPIKFVILILHGFNKKKQKTPEKELSIAIKRYADYKVRSKMVDK